MYNLRVRSIASGNLHKVQNESTEGMEICMMCLDRELKIGPTLLPFGWGTQMVIRKCVWRTCVVRLVSSTSPIANSGGPSEPKDEEPRLGYNIPTTRTHIPRHIYLGDSSHHISAPSYTQSFLIYTL